MEPTNLLRWKEIKHREEADSDGTLAFRDVHGGLFILQQFNTLDASEQLLEPDNKGEWLSIDIG